MDLHYNFSKIEQKAREDLADQETLEWRFFNEMVRLIWLRKAAPAFKNGGMEVIDTGNPHLFGYLRQDRLKGIRVSLDSISGGDRAFARLGRKTTVHGPWRTIQAGKRQVEGKPVQGNVYHSIIQSIPDN